jgi:iron complex outermembrane receptor protein
MKLYSKIIVGLFLFILCLMAYTTQAQTLDVDKLSKKEILNMDYEQLLDMPFEDLLKLSEKVGLSADDLMATLMNRDVKSASKKAESAIESPLSTTVLTRDEIMQSGAKNIPEALRLVPGIIVREKSTGNYDVHIRGNDNLPNKHLMFYSENSISLIMIDGRPVFNYAHGGTFWETLPVSIIDVERIEVIRGPSSALYGPNAVSGAINIITRESQETKATINADLQAGTQSTFIGNLNVSVPITSKLKIRASGYYHKMDRQDENFYVWYKPEGSYVPYDSLGKTNNPSTGSPYVKDISKIYTDPMMAQDRYAANLFLNYNPNSNVGIDISAGLQDSNVITSILDNSNVSSGQRISNTKYVDLRGNAYGFNAQVSYMTGEQNANMGTDGYIFNPNTLHTLLEYDWNLGKLNLRPGVSYQNATYDDTDYVNAEINEGIFNGRKTLSNFSVSLRADYRPTEKLRFIAALRAEKYSKPDKTYPTYQFVGTYKLKENHLVRAVYSRANRGPFMSDVYTSYNWKRVKSDFGVLPEEIPIQLIQYRGKEDLELMKMDMIELGFRNKVTNNLFTDIEIFYTKAQDYGYFVANDYEFMINPDIPPALAANLPTDLLIKHIITYQYDNLPMVSEQMGITLSLDLIASSKFRIKAYGTLQQTDLTNYLDRSPDQSYLNLLQTKYNEASNPSERFLYASVLQQLGVPTEAFGMVSDDLKDMEHKSTPKFYGGFMANYTPIKNLNLNANVYFLGEQEFIFQYGNDVTDPKTILNIKADYKIWKENSIYFNARNILGQNHNEFMFMDKVGTQYLVGASINF